MSRIVYCMSSLFIGPAQHLNISDTGSVADHVDGVHEPDDLDGLSEVCVVSSALRSSVP